LLFELMTVVITMASVPTVAAMTIVTAVTTMHEHVQERAREQQQEWRIGQGMIAMAGQDQEAGKRREHDAADEESRQAPIRL